VGGNSFKCQRGNPVIIISGCGRLVIIKDECGKSVITKNKCGRLVICRKIYAALIAQ
jgi:hypothetical protein